MEKLFNNGTVTEFSNKPISRKVMKAIMKDVMNAPSAGEQCPWEFYIVTDDDTKWRLSECARYAKPAKDAPVVVVPCYQRRCKHPAYVLQDMAAACNNMLLSAGLHDIGAYWVGIAPKVPRMELVSNVLTLPRHLHPFSIMCLGYPATGEIPKKPKRYDPEKLHFTTNPDNYFE